MISVVMATYNASRFVGEAIESIIAQTYPHWELIAIDDGSTDNTREILRTYAAQDSRIRIIQAEHGGASRARNLGIQAAQYPWIAVMDADDIALPQRFEKQIQAAQEKPHVVAWGSAFHHINAAGKILSLSHLGPETEKQFYEMRQAGHVVNLNNPTVLLKREIALKVGGYDPHTLAGHDLDLLDRMAAYGPILALPDPLLLYRIHMQSISMQRFFLQRQAMRYVRHRHLARLAGKDLTLEEYLQQRQQRPAVERAAKYLETLGIFYYRKAGLLVGEANYLSAVFHLGLAIVCNPGYAFPKIWGQVLSPKTRKMVQKSASRQ
ncbi:glycosyltransferase [Geitlerinema sp. PCC 9228]|uniref:glycosyltransferase family 2 protein n=1 Tax=Geitlerinema sp. PCC 9228 TaxID=111611 RepID=UPI0008F9D323|nr:glycosyltransferase [Geitlerinema sp. PCC 9228]